VVQLVEPGTQQIVGRGRLVDDPAGNAVDKITKGATLLR
jgi:hypothetical protein